ncbi:major facilitator superfamily transporter permease [Streptomyces pristinaespiralis ATCC 25486]|uniref:Major facilitator superfamily transporter permease n=1 Tax=Streptomyces pristinaespiralis (strain ATCC 25486 / DSM 40338 / CBS 914.69 / JCM 4507 / KCC S-0507 / NBRC 13074 / NRRL 2958 / 5647) TaxID=457429 RepID=B5H6U3_STRE2|nr:major facilitator superfamily transporter permease [Streptomyces pristinaespiralis ATCC 25486]
MERPAAEPAASRKAWLIVGLLVCLVLANVADKIVVGLAGIDIKKDLGLDDAQLGVVQSSFFWLFAVGSVLGGWLGGKIRARWLLGGMVLLWAITMAPMVSQVGFTMLVVCRVLLGFAEGPAAALVMQVVHSWFPAHKRAVPSSIVTAGTGLGPVIAAPALTWVITDYSWHAAFGVLAAAGMAFALVWMLVGDSGPEAAGKGHPSAEGTATQALPERVPLRRLFSTGTLIGTVLLFFVIQANSAIKISWLPLYLEEGLGYDSGTIGRLVALPYLGAAISVIVVGVFSRWLTRRGLSNRIARGVLPASMIVLAGLATMAFSGFDRGTPHMVLLITSASLNAAGFGVAFAGISDVVPAKQRGMVFGIVTACFSLGGVIAPVVVGGLVASSESAAAGYGSGFLGLGVVMVVGGAIAMLLINPERDTARLAARD